jgi:hypothetical protein
MDRDESEYGTILLIYGRYYTLDITVTAEF